MKPTTFNPVEVILTRAHCPKCNRRMIKGSNTMCVRCEQAMNATSDAIEQNIHKGNRLLEIFKLTINFYLT